MIGPLGQLIYPLLDGSRYCSNSSARVLLVGLSRERIFCLPPDRADSAQIPPTG